ncbi:MAG: hypothetical protein RR828_07295, partial [Oscillospiraceae bacterium]
LNLTVTELIDSTTIANSPGSTIKTGTMRNSTLMNNFLFGPSENKITKIIVKEPTVVGTGFYGNAVIGPAKVYSDDNSPVLAKAENCYYLPTANEGDNGYGIWVPSDINKLECAGDPTVYVEGESTGSRPDCLASCPTFLISTKRVPNTEVAIRDSHMRYSLVSEFSNGRAKTENPSENPFGYCSYLMPDGNIAENIVWTSDSSCTYTVYTNKGYQKEDDIYALTGLDFPLQFDVRNLIHDRKNEEIELKVTAEHRGADFVVSWDKPTGYGNLKVGKLFCKILSDKNDVVLEYELKSGELAAGKAVTLYTAENKLPEGKQCKIWAVLQDKEPNPGYIAKGETV